ncbi:hypothetical protein FNQ90_14715 [Streptomyces alkaliphilus]|uniref:DUF4232 domain-containing protein n=1 Tax=Streptomyces alkaliphilus TaxID=1472722 RepID=A0A7W3TEH4_9ACTN|nr:hypothetical protein [Streptomyces alkaliphilus]MBB0245318.1 hypothetical protein [Streptomyces alkaliphilus]
MGSLRTPVGPLPSSIYWRRRAVALLLLASLGLLVWWAMNIGGTGSTGSGDDGAGGPATSISPEPDEDGDGDGDLVEDRPGGRDPGDEDDDADDDAGEDTGDAEGTDDGTGDGADGDGDPAGPGAGDVEGIAIDDPAAPAGSGGAGGSDGGSSGGSTGSGGAVPASLPRCPGGALELSLSPVSNSYPPGELPRLRLTLTNTSSADCRADLGHRSFTLTMTRTDDGNRTIWDSTTCPTGSASAPVAVPADDGTERIITWDRRRSVEDCDTRGPEAPYGTYLAEAEIDGFPVARTTFRLEED